jgi:2-polyprenyl-3-methyl-5-hydroxy-6-metoxy-1,4-benzoquinol methylase
VKKASTFDDRTAYFDRMVADADWDERANPVETERRVALIFDRLLAGVDLHGQKLLDAGSGGGHFSEEAVRRGAAVTSLDVGENVLDQVRRRCESTRVLGDILALPFPDRSFDVVLSTEVIEHTVDPVRALAELCRVIGAGGWLVVTSPNRLWQPVVRAATRLGLRRHLGYENFLWAHRARSTVESAGLVVERFVGFNVLPLFQQRFEPFLDWSDAVLGQHAPDAFVNYAVLARRR